MVKRFMRILMIMIAWTVDFTAAGSCRAAKLCCQGRDSGCVIQKASPNAIIESPRDTPCYCDHACLKLNDCCNDFKEACNGKFFFIFSLINLFDNHMYLIILFNVSFSFVRDFKLFNFHLCFKVWTF